MRAIARTARGTMLATFPPAALVLLALALVSGLVLLFLLADRSGHGEGRPDLAVSTDPISLYVVDDGEVEERRSGVAPAWSPDGEQLAYKGDHDGNVWVDDRAFPLGVDPDGRLEWTPDGRSLLFEGNGIRVLDVKTGVDRPLAAGTLPALSPDGRTVRISATRDPSAPGVDPSSTSSRWQEARRASSRERRGLSTDSTSSRARSGFPTEPPSRSLDA